jgi:NAD(P)-dependent dehydrogenase (short-subunit alcohol dehydrogenase family)
VPNQQGRTIVITGANTGVGFETAKVLAASGATVVLASRDPERAGRAVQRLEADLLTARLDTITLDLASLASVRSAAAELRSRHARIDVLINNAGVMWTPKGRTADGFETHFGTNHLGHFAFTGRAVEPSPPARQHRLRRPVL